MQHTLGGQRGEAANGHITPGGGELLQTSSPKWENGKWPHNPAALAPQNGGVTKGGDTPRLSVHKHGRSCEVGLGKESAPRGSSLASPGVWLQ